MNSAQSTDITSVLPSLGLGTVSDTDPTGARVRLGFYHPQTVSATHVLGAGIDFIANANTSTWGETGDIAFNFNTGSSTLTMAEKMRIKANGNVGIGTASPGQKLEVAGSTYITSGMLMLPGSNAGLWGGQIGFGNSQSMEWMSFPNINHKLSLTAIERGAKFHWDSADNQLVLRDSGNVGIGTDSPGNPLTIFGANDSTPILSLGNDAGVVFNFARNQSTGALSIQGTQTGYNNIVLAPTSGNVGIGTASPTGKLTISAPDDSVAFHGVPLQGIKDLDLLPLHGVV